MSRRLKITGVTSRAVWFVGGIFPCNRFVIRRMTGAAEYARPMRLVIGREMRVGRDRRPRRGIPMTLVARLRRDKMAAGFACR